MRLLKPRGEYARARPHSSALIHPPSVTAVALPATVAERGSLETPPHWGGSVTLRQRSTCTCRRRAFVPAAVAKLPDSQQGINHVGRHFARLPYHGYGVCEPADDDRVGNVDEKGAHHRNKEERVGRITLAGANRLHVCNGWWRRTETESALAGDQHCCFVVGPHHSKRDERRVQRDADRLQCKDHKHRQGE